MTRTEASSVIAGTIEANDYAASVWAPEGEAGLVRVYVTIPAANWKKKAQKIGYVSVNKDGSVTSELNKQSGAIMALLPDLQITPVNLSTQHANKNNEPVDEITAAFQKSERTVNRAEENREQG